MADRELQTILNSGELNSVYLGGTASADKVVKQSELTEVDTKTTVNTTNISANTSRITTLETSMVSFHIGTLRAEQTFTKDTWAKVDWTPEDSGEATVTPIIEYGTDLTYDSNSFEIDVNTTGYYRISGTATIDATINDIFSVGIMLDTPSPLEPQFVINGIGQNTSDNPLPVSMPWTIVIPISSGDQFTIWAKTSGTKLQVHRLSFTIEKLPY